jgi:AGZA family xanthine/uracil permease-like MFS transporter
MISGHNTGSATATSRYAWAQWGDVNAFFGLMLDNVAVMILLVLMVTGPGSQAHFTREFVLTQMIPGTVLGVVIGDLTYTWLAFRLARQSGRTDVTAMPLGLDTPSTVAVGPLVLIPALETGLRHGLDHDQAMVFGWQTGAMVLVLSGIFKTVLAPIGDAVRRAVPRAGLLGSLAAIALTLIAFVPMYMHITAIPVVGMVSLIIILVALVAHWPLPGKMPGALAAAAVGIILYFGGDFLSRQFGLDIVPPHDLPEAGTWRLPNLLPDFTRSLAWWEDVGVEALSRLPVMLPFALATVVGGIDCTESAAAAGDEYNTRTILWTEGLATLAAGICGGVIQNTPYIGQPAYKAMGGRAAYTLANAVFVGLAGLFGWFAWLFIFLPEPAMFPILVFIGLEITAQSFGATPVRHYAALALAMLPALAYMALIPVDAVLAGAAPNAGAAVGIKALRCLANGFIITSMLWAAALAAILDHRLGRAAAYLGFAALCSLFGIIHSPLDQAEIAQPFYVLGEMGSNPAIRCQSPFHWTAAYLLAALVLVLLDSFRPAPAKPQPDSQ